jgi:hypothetical protein
MLGPLHVDEVDDDDPAEIAEPDLPDDLGGGLEVDLEHRLLEVPLAHVLARVHVDGHEGFRVVDDDVAAGLEPDAAAERLLDLLLDPRGLEDGGHPVVELDPGGELRHQRLGEVQALLVGGGGVDLELVDIRREQVADHAKGEIHLLVKEGGGAGRLEAALHLAPQPREELHVGLELLGRLAFGHRAHDEPPRRRLELLDDAAKAVALGVVPDAARHPDVTVLGHVDDVAPRDGHEGGDARALRPQRLLGDLDQDFLALVQHLLDGYGGLAPVERLGARLRVALAVTIINVRRILFRVGSGRSRIVAPIGRVISTVEEGVLLESDVDEGRLHARKDIGDHAFVDIADDGAAARPLHVELHELRAILHGETGFRHAGVNNDALSHGSSPQFGGIRPRCTTRGPLGGGPGYWNCRIRTERRSPSAMNDTTMDEPP